MLHTDGPAAPTPQLHPSPSQRSPWKPHSCPRAKAHAHADTVRGSQTLKTPGPPIPGLAGCGPGRGELPGSWTMLMNMILAGLLSGVEQQKVPVYLEVRLLCAGPGVAQEWTSVPSALSDTPRPLSQLDFYTDGGDTEGGQGSQHGGCRRSLLPAPVPPHTSVGPR